jgi:hypothetical protein
VQNFLEDGILRIMFEVVGLIKVGRMVPVLELA